MKRDARPTVSIIGRYYDSYKDLFSDWEITTNPLKGRQMLLEALMANQTRKIIHIDMDVKLGRNLLQQSHEPVKEFY